MPTTEIKLVGHRIDPSVSIPTTIATKFAATNIAESLLDLQGNTDKRHKDSAQKNIT
jgi:hypothetical protein